METGEVEPWTRNQGREARDEVYWIEEDMGRAVARAADLAPPLLIAAL